MKEIRNTLIPFPGFKAINLFGVLFVRTGATMTEADYNHEAIHTAQMRELGYIPFYILYLLEWLYLWLTTSGTTKQAYFAVSFEKEAYGNEDNTQYLRNRPRFAQWKS